MSHSHSGFCMTPTKLYSSVVEFLLHPSLEYAPVTSRKMPAEINSPQQNLSLFEYMLGSAPEKRAQDALFPFLAQRFGAGNV